MFDDLGTSDARLAKLVRRIMKEKAPVEFDGLCSQLWVVLDEWDNQISVESRVGRASKSVA
jgi:hypothetical protein